MKFGFDWPRGFRAKIFENGGWTKRRARGEKGPDQGGSDKVILFQDPWKI